MNEKRSRGRPVGSGGKNDSKYLHQVADILMGNPKMKPTSAMRQVICKQAGAVDANSDAAMLRRMQHKWKRDASTYMEAAQARARPVARRASGNSFFGINSELQESIRQLLRPTEEMRHIQEELRRHQEAIRAALGPIKDFQKSFGLGEHSELFKSINEMSKNFEKLTRPQLPLLELTRPLR